ncbi:MAG: hypothetical protein DMD50_13355 [Gemmatimonadetes bacterium]|nr:MAG: hypothetical protein DMD50_13355 [Gemmatimonadota bacterium]
MTRVPLSISVPVLMTRYLCLAFVLLIAGCWGNYWGRRPVDQPTPIDPGDPVWIWTRGGVEKWRTVVVTQDSVSGIPFEMSRKCTTCRRSIPRVQVDSMKHGYRTLAETVTDIVGPITLLIVAEYTVGLVVNWLR